MKTKLLTLVCLLTAIQYTHAQLDSTSVSKQGFLQSSLNVNRFVRSSNAALGYEQAHMLNQHWMLGAKVFGGQQGGSSIFGLNPYARYYFGKRSKQKTHFFAGAQIQSSLLFTEEVQHNFTYGPQLGLNHFLTENIALELSNNLWMGNPVNSGGRSRWQTRLQLRSFSSLNDTEETDLSLRRGSLLLGQNWLRFERSAQQDIGSFSLIEFSPDIQYFLTDRFSIGTDSRVSHTFNTESEWTSRYDLNLQGRYYFSKGAWPLFVESNLNYYAANTRNDFLSASYDEWKVGAALGFTKSFGNGMALDMKLGVERVLSPVINQGWLAAGKIGIKFNIGN